MILIARSVDGGDTWMTHQLSPAADVAVSAGFSMGRQACTIRTDSAGTVYVFWVGFAGERQVIYLTRSFDGGTGYRPARPVAEVSDCGAALDPVSGRGTFDGVAGTRIASLPSVDIANGAPTGANATDVIL